MAGGGASETGSPGRLLSVAEVLARRSAPDVSVRGWVSAKAGVGGIVFIVLRDGTGYLQVSAKKGTAPSEVVAAMKGVPRESVVAVRGAAREDKRAPRGVEVAAQEFQVISKAEPWPITKTAVKSASYLYDMRHLSIRGRKAVATMKVRAEIIGAASDYFRERGFTLISAPSFVQAAVEGGSTLFEVEYFGKKAYLSQSAQFYEEAALAGLEKVWICQPAFRAEKSRTAKHLTEFWMIEAEQAFADQEANMRLQEGFLAFAVDRILERRSDELAILGRKLSRPDLPLERVSYDKVRELAESKGLPFEWGEDIPAEAEREVSMSKSAPFFVTDFPLSARSFYHMTYEDRPYVTRSADLIAPEGFGELATGGQRIAEYYPLLQRIKSQDLPAEAFSWYLDLRKFGMPYHSGFGMGVERLTRWVGGLKNIRSASLFPRTTTRVSP
ncbi:MAG TPA: aspartate--tRNA(Asn) ligase [Nitrososphaerales archaeon]|nr:aspartate--tRNA(Asn) ligase [Nitrososphaerales archaeon]